MKVTGCVVAALSWHVHLNGDREALGMSAVNVPVTVAGGFCVVGDDRTPPLRFADIRVAGRGSSGRFGREGRGRANARGGET